ncbi:hypothetical protein PVAND_013024 [Polypedilum vanderplanki]|uniref:Sulfatase N-terminal domain-containing protein n=1 Tax=Polypedilum vanderplanki TaxID=319348 RepID=A0A9J6CPG5_POLVA|nr:hypothetical protein PVAND_013024 [Polypedilum vanderplanki]
MNLKFHIEKLADDLGFNDVSYRGSNEIPTYNIDALAYGGIVLDRFYTAPMCTPSRSALMTGKYPFHTGMQNFMILSDEPWGLPLNEKVMPQYFKEAGYSTHLIGKWHLGSFKKSYTPMQRGYDTFFGYHGPYIGYFDYTHKMFTRNYSRGYDLRRNANIEWRNDRVYATDMFTKEAVAVIENLNNKNPFFMMVNHLAPHAGNEDVPLEAKEEDIRQFSYIKNPRRQILSAMVKSLDDSVGEIVSSLRRKNVLKDTIIIFYSDNGGPTEFLLSTTASNYPLKGQKQSAWEGGIRTAAIIYAPFLPQGVIRNRYFYIADFLPTLLTISNANVNISTPIDGMDLSNMLMNDRPPYRDEVLTIDDIFGYSSYIRGDFKLVNGSSSEDGIADKWLGSNNNTNVNAAKYLSNVLNSKVAISLQFPLTERKISSLRKKTVVKCGNNVANNCNLLKGPCLFNIINDPCEKVNLATTQKAKMTSMLLRFNQKLKTVVPALRKPPNPNCDPIFFNLTWTNWDDYPPHIVI